MAATNDKEKPVRVMVVDDESGVLFSVQQILAGYDVDVFEDPLVALAALSSREYDVLIIDYKMPDLNGIDFLVRARVLLEDSYKILLTAFAEKEILQEGINSSLINRVIEKPFRRKVLLDALQAALEYLRARRGQEREMALLLSGRRSRQASLRRTGWKVIGLEAGLKPVAERLQKAAEESVNVLFTGEAGTGKELLAWYLHVRSAGEEAPFHSIDCRNADEEELDRRLFGEDREAGAVSLADGGTLVLCGIDALPSAVQKKMLGVLQDRELVRLGGKPPRRVDFRLMATVRMDLRKAVDSGIFREDLYYAVNAFPVTLPPLRERTGDIPALLDHFLTVHADAAGIPVPGLDPAVAVRLGNYRWEGNVAELENAVQRVVLSLSGRDRVEPDMFDFLEDDRGAEDVASAIGTLADAVAAGRISYASLEGSFVEALLKKTGKDREALRKMGIPGRLL